MCTIYAVVAAALWLFIPKVSLLQLEKCTWNTIVMLLRVSNVGAVRDCCEDDKKKAMSLRIKAYLPVVTWNVAWVDDWQLLGGLTINIHIWYGVKLPALLCKGLQSNFVVRSVCLSVCFRRLTSVGLKWRSKKTVKMCLLYSHMYLNRGC
jgi:hypothetical protein